MVSQPENNNDPQPNDPQPVQPTPDTESSGSPTPPTAQQKLQRLLERVPPRFRTKKWAAAAVVTLLLFGLWAGDAIAKAASAPDAPEPAPATAIPEPTPTPVTALIPDRPTPTPLPSQYAFTHFVREMANCYRQRGLEASLEGVEADIMVDVPLAVNELMKLYSNNECAEEEPWHQIRGRVGWMLRAADVPLR